ncbi:class I SAM-dependent methyltransferase [Jatrophihabitans lederbergiae]|uniref:Class I SAM-dependent methyltransferase n=1 Tax=Jatrophihabitans lederbergiae TaxID=3075547 RepID=A0ABU2J6M2_9ACTN|nr:class I SAM-dependent methyltransferase [Jatrophihabitans sp. DSM 44399]MDT0260353.1 class I SAM-dependent methyltransferase [Jatrophihabitans sp. DSM 44399]
MDRPNALLRVKGLYAAGARGTGGALTKVGVLNEQAPERDRRVKHWLYSLTRAYDSVAIAKLDVPWWTYRAIDVVDAWLAAHPKPIRVFEYGSGASTLWLARRAEEVHSVEHHREFGEHIAASFAAHPNIDFRIVEPVRSTNPAIGSRKEGNAGLDFAGYVASIDDVPGQFSLIVIDGRAREACLRKARGRLEEGGIIVFDNTRRRRYREAIAASGLPERRLGGLTPTLPYPDQTSILTAPAL